jgi:hypothetical protein
MEDEAERGGGARRAGKILAWLVILAVIGVAAFFHLRNTRPVAPPPAVEGEADRAPLVRHPVPEVEPAPEQQAEPSGLTPLLPISLPELDDSDPAMLKLAEYLVKNPDLAALLVPNDVIRRLVVTVDNLAGRGIPVNRLPVKLPEGAFIAGKAGDQFVIDPRNYARYRRYVALLDGLDSHDLVNAYVHFYPLFQQAYRELGYPQGFFNDRLIAVIDDVLKTPEVRDPVRLEQPVVFYTYADDRLEALSAGQRQLLRMGPDNAAAIKRKLSEIRVELTK